MFASQEIADHRETRNRNNYDDTLEVLVTNCAYDIRIKFARSLENFFFWQGSSKRAQGLIEGAMPAASHSYRDYRIRLVTGMFPNLMPIG